MADDRNASIQAYVNSLDWSDANKAASAAALNQAAQQYGVSAAEIAGATGYNTGDVYTLMGGYQPTNAGVADQAAQYGWDANYTKAQDDLVSIRSYMGASGQPYIVTGNASMADGGNSVASLPGWLNQAGIKSSQNMLDSYKGVTGYDYKPGQTTTGYTSINNGNSGVYTIKNPDGSTLQSKPTSIGGYVTNTAPAAYKPPPAAPAPAPIGTSNKPPAVSSDATAIIKAQLSGLNGKSQADLDAWFRSTPYDAATLAAASGYNLSDVQAAMAKARGTAPAPAPGQGAPTGAPGQASPAAQPNAIADIQAQVASLNGKPQAELDAWFRTTPYSPAQIAAATGYNEADVQAAMAKARGSSPSASGAPQLGYNLSQVSGPTQWNVDNNQLVASQLEKIIASDSPLMQQARAQALQQMNARGTLNSSMAETAAQSAVIAAADKVAQADAGTYGKAAQYNADATNAFTREDNAFVRQGVMADYNLNANEWAARQAYERQQAAQREQNAFNLSAMDRENTLNQSNTANANKQNDRQGYINALNQSRNEWAGKYAALMADPNMSAENKRDAFKNLAQSYNTQIKQYTTLLGWDYESWDIEYTDDTPAATTSPTTNGNGESDSQGNLPPTRSK